MMTRTKRHKNYVRVAKQNMYILFDIGGTKMRLAASRDGESFDEPKIVETPHNFEEGIKTFNVLARELSEGEKLTAISGGLRGTLNEKKNGISYDVILTDWVGKPLGDRLEDLCGAPVYLENDTALVGLGEATAGAAKDADIVVYITVSTGVGGARIVGKKIDRRAFSFEPGKQIIDPDNTLCPDCPGNTLEEYVSGSAVEKRFGKKAYEIKQDDPLWDILAEWLSYGLHNMIVHWSPEVVVLGGSMIVGDPAISVEKTHEHLKKTLKVFPECPDIRKAELGAFGGLHGALELIRNKRKHNAE
jgi:predicted NBD/HSP70 family sugar kinase